MKLIGMNYYPTKKELKKIEEWEITTGSNLIALIKYAGGMWIRFGSDNTFKFSKGDSYKLTMITTGWSGNEDIIEALEKNQSFWRGWDVIKRGGFYSFEWNKGDIYLH